MKIFAHTQKDGLVDYFATEQDLADDFEKDGWSEISVTEEPAVIDQVGNNIWQDLFVKDAAGRYNFKLSSGQAVKRTEEEKAQDPAAVSVPTQLDRVEAQAFYTAMMTSTLLEV